MRIYCLPASMIHANTYVIAPDDSNDAVIIDPTRNIQLKSLLEQHNLRPVAILLTHGHFDHTSALPSFTEDFPVPVYLHSGDAPMLEDGQCNALHYLFPDKLFEPIKEYQPVSEGQLLSLGGLEFKVLSTPGHSNGSVCYWIEDCLFSGDTLFKGSYGRFDLWGGNGQKLQASLRRILLMDSSIKVYPGHGEMTTIAQEYRRYKNN
jgi:glyoxylase-like metal-dependent hydrolase (beta-lactamase superfamily II)